MQVTQVNGVWYKYDDTMLTARLQALRAGNAVYVPQQWVDGVVTSWLAIAPEDVPSALVLMGGDVRIIRAERMSWQEVYEHLWTEQESRGKRYTGVWSGYYDLASWLRTSVEYARTEVRTNLQDIEATQLAATRGGRADPTLLNYLRERESVFNDFLAQTKVPTVLLQVDLDAIFHGDKGGG